jgi:hypothetical protein
MPYTATAFLWRKPGTTPEEFKTYYKTTHIPLLKEKVGTLFPLTHTRHYLTRTAVDPSSSSDKTNANYPVTVYGGTVDDFGYYVYSEMVFENFEKFMAFAVKMAEVEASDKGWNQDIANFLDVGEKARRIVAVDDLVVGYPPKTQSLHVSR